MFPNKNYYFIEYSYEENDRIVVNKEVIGEGRGLKREIEKLKNEKKGFKLINVKSLSRES